MFTGDSSGDFLYAALHRTGWATQPTSVAAGDGLELNGMRIIASVRCAPPANQPTAQERQTCRGWLIRDLELSQPHTIMCLGALAWDAVLAAGSQLGWPIPRPKPQFGHNRRLQIGAVELVGCYHVSPHNTYTKRLTAEMLDEVLLSLRCETLSP